MQINVQKIEAAEKTFFVFMLFVLSGSLFPFNMDSYLAGESKPLQEPHHLYFQLVLGGLYSVTGILLLARWRQAIHAVRSCPWIVLLLLFACLSVLWSTAPELTLRRAVAFLGTNMLGFYLISRFSLQETTNLLMISFSLGFIASLVLILFFPEYGINPAPHEGAWRGVFAMKNGAGTYFSLAFLAFLVNASFSNGIKFLTSLLGIMLSLLLTLKSDSKTALVLVFLLTAAFIFFVFYIPRVHRTRKMWAVAALVIASLALWGGYPSASHNQPNKTQQPQTNSGSFSSSFLQTLNRYKTLTGRTLIWSAILDETARRPLAGYGYIGRTWPPHIGAPYSQIRKTIHHKLNFYVTHSHNGYIHLFLALGGVGILLLILTISTSIKDWLLCVVQRGIEYDTMCAGLFFLWFLTYNITDTLIAAQNLIYWPLFIIFAIHMRWQRIGLDTTMATVKQEV